MTEQEVKEEWKRLEELRQTNFNEYVDELTKPWVGMDADMEMFQGVLFEYQRRTGNPIKMVEECHIPDDPDEPGYVKLPKWHTEAKEAFFKAYGEDEGWMRFTKASSFFWFNMIPKEKP